MDYSTPELFRELFNTHYPSVRRKLISLVRDETAAEDLAQEVFIRLYRNPPDDLNAMGAWLHRVLTRIGYDYLNKKARERALVEKQGRLGGWAEGESASNEQLMLDRLDREQVHEWLNTLSTRDRKVLMLRYSGYSYNEIAEHLQVRRPLVGTLVQRATTRFKHQAERHGGEDQLNRGIIQ